MTPRCQGRDPVIFEAAIKLFNFYHCPTHLTYLIYTDFTFGYRDALDRLRVRLNSILLLQVRLQVNENITDFQSLLLLRSILLCCPGADPHIKVTGSKDAVAEAKEKVLNVLNTKVRQSVNVIDGSTFVSDCCNVSC